MVTLVRAGAGLSGRAEATVRRSLVTTVLDGVIAAIAFSILVLIAFNATTGVALPRSGNTAIVIAYSVTELVVVVAGVLMAMVTQPIAHIGLIICCWPAASW